MRHVMWYHGGMKAQNKGEATYLSVRQAAKFLGTPVSFIKAEVNRSRLFKKRHHIFLHGLKKSDLIRYREDVDASQVWKEFKVAGYVAEWEPGDPV